MDVTLRLDRGIPDVSWARHELLDVMEHSEVEADPDRVGLVVTELLTNALLHGREPVEVHISTVEDHLRIEVHDSSEAVPLERRAEPTDVTGRGLMLVAGLVERWGVDQSGDGKYVWAEFDAATRTSAATRTNARAGAEAAVPEPRIQPSETVAASSAQRSSVTQGAFSTA